MRLDVNGVEAALPEGSGTLGDVVGALRRDAAAAGRIIATFVLDGEVLTLEGEAGAAARPASECRSLGAEVVPPEELVRKVFQGLEATLPTLVAGVQGAADLARRGQVMGPDFGRVAEDLAFVLDAFRDGENLLAMAGRSFPRRDGRAVSRIESALGDVVNAMGSNDLVRLGDALEHEFSPALATLGEELREWARILPAGVEAVPVGAPVGGLEDGAGT
jgi:hypothetical protein